MLRSGFFMDESGQQVPVPPQLAQQALEALMGMRGGQAPSQSPQPGRMGGAGPMAAPAQGGAPLVEGRPPANPQPGTRYRNARGIEFEWADEHDGQGWGWVQIGG